MAIEAMPIPQGILELRQPFRGAPKRGKLWTFFLTHQLVRERGCPLGVCASCGEETFFGRGNSQVELSYEPRQPTCQTAREMGPEGGSEWCTPAFITRLKSMSFLTCKMEIITQPKLIKSRVVYYF